MTDEVYSKQVVDQYLAGIFELLGSVTRTVAEARRCGQSGFPNQLIADSRLFFAESSLGSWFDVGCGVGVLRAVHDREGSEAWTTASRSPVGAGRCVLDRSHGHGLA